MMKSIRQFFRVSSFWFLVLTGCSSGNSPVEVKGIVTLDDQPVVGATVVFMPEGGKGRPASALTDGEGYFSLTTFQEGDGAFPGEYRVLVQKSEGSTEAPLAIEPEEHKSVVAHYKSVMERRKPKSVLPAVYADAALTPLRCSVPPGKTVTLELHSKPKK